MRHFCWWLFLFNSKFVRDDCCGWKFDQLVRS